MKKIIYLVVLAATFSLATSCNGKDKEHSDDDMEDMTMVVASAETFIA